MHQLAASFVLGYHGCDHEVAEYLLRTGRFRQSRNDYDWLGPGIYFWEANPRRGLEFARESKRRGTPGIRRPTVVGAVIELGLCLDLTTAAGVQQVRTAYAELASTARTAGAELPKNGKDLLLRKLDCAVIRVLHGIREGQGQPPIDTVRGVFLEGDPIFPDSGFHEKTHTQIAVRNPDRIKGVFRVHPRSLR